MAEYEGWPKILSGCKLILLITEGNEPWDNPFLGRRKGTWKKERKKERENNPSLDQNQPRVSFQKCIFDK